MITLLQGKKILLGVCGSIAAYKVADLASKLTQAGAEVNVVMTEAAQKFVTPLTFEALTGRTVYTNVWASASSSALPVHIAHVALGEASDLIVVAPATANTIAKLAHGQADDLLTITALAARCPIMVIPAMDGAMYEHPATQQNVQTLRDRGVIIIEPERGRFASGLEGRGRLPETPTLLGEIRRVLARAGVLAGCHVVVTAGGTREALDPVRFISNHSSGKQGYAIAQAALDAGANVTLISTVEALPIPIGAQVVRVNAAAEMREAVLAHADCDALIMAAAVADFRPATIADQKIKKEKAETTIQLAKNDDIIALVGAQRQATHRPRVLVGFAAETENLLDNAQSKLERKNADMIVANNLTQPGAGFASDTNIVTLITRHHAPESIPMASKAAVAELIITRVAHLLADHPH